MEKIKYETDCKYPFLLAVKQKLWGLSHAKLGLKTAGF